MVPILFEETLINLQMSWKMLTFAAYLQRVRICNHNNPCHKTIKTMNYIGLLIAIATFLIIGIFHPIVIKSEYHFGVKCWWVFLIAGLCFIGASLFVEGHIASPLLGVIGCSCLWSILEIFEQRQRVKKGWFPMNPKRKDDYK